MGLKFRVEPVFPIRQPLFHIQTPLHRQTNYKKLRMQEKTHLASTLSLSTDTHIHASHMPIILTHPQTHTCPFPGKTHPHSHNPHPHTHTHTPSPTQTKPTFTHTLTTTHTRNTHYCLPLSSSLPLSSPPPTKLRSRNTT